MCHRRNEGYFFLNVGPPLHALYMALCTYMQMFFLLKSDLFIFLWHLRYVSYSAYLSVPGRFLSYWTQYCSSPETWALSEKVATVQNNICPDPWSQLSNYWMTANCLMFKQRRKARLYVIILAISQGYREVVQYVNCTRVNNYVSGPDYLCIDKKNEVQY